MLVQWVYGTLDLRNSSQYLIGNGIWVFWMYIAAESIAVIVE